MTKYEYKHITIPFTDEQMVLIGIPLASEQRGPLDSVLETALNEAGAEGWRVVPPLVLPIVLLERETTDG
jgi:hypothetical protein